MSHHYQYLKYLFIHLFAYLLLQGIKAKHIGISRCFIPKAIFLDRLGREIMIGSKIGSHDTDLGQIFPLYHTLYGTLLYHSDSPLYKTGYLEEAE